MVNNDFTNGENINTNVGETQGANGGENQVSGPIKNKPKLIVSAYTLTPKMVEAGDDFELNITLYNTNADNAVYNLKVSLDQNSSTQASSQAGGNSSNFVAEGSVFAPVGRSNTFYRAAIYPWNYTAEEIKMNVLPNTKAGNYQMGVNLEYEDYLGNQYQTTEIIGIPVVASAKISTGDISMDELFQGEEANVSINIYNTGKDGLTNFMCKVEGEGFDVDENSHFIGNFAQGASDNFSFNIKPKEEGTIKGKIILTYEDSAGKEHTEEREFSKKVEAGMNENVDENGNPIEGQSVDGPSPIYTSPILWVSVLVIVALAIYFIRKRRKKKKEEKELSIEDED